MKKNILFLSGLFFMLSVLLIFICNKPTGLLLAHAVKHFILVLSPLSAFVLMVCQKKDQCYSSCCPGGEIEITATGVVAERVIFNARPDGRFGRL
jgi:hypothetical protein